jgi:hypothetical protein
VTSRPWATALHSAKFQQVLANGGTRARTKKHDHDNDGDDDSNSDDSNDDNYNDDDNDGGNDGDNDELRAQRRRERLLSTLVPRVWCFRRGTSVLRPMPKCRLLQPRMPSPRLADAPHELPLHGQRGDVD